MDTRDHEGKTARLGSTGAGPDVRLRPGPDPATRLRPGPTRPGGGWAPPPVPHPGPAPKPTPTDGPVLPVADAARSVLVRLHNNTPHDLELVRADLAHGKWSGPDYGVPYTPPGTIYGGTTWSWESQSHGFMTGTQGTAVYAVATTAVTVEIRWDNPYAGHDSYKGIGPQPYLITHIGGSGDNACIDFTVALVTTPMTAETNDQEIGQGSGHWMNSTAAMASNGVVSGHTHAWVTSDLSGFHGSVFPAVLDADGAVIWFGTKRTYGPDADWAPGTPSSYSEPWHCTAPPDVVATGHSLVLFQFADPKNMLVRDLGILKKTVDIVAEIIKTFEGGGK